MVEPLFYQEHLDSTEVGSTQVLIGAEAKHAVSVRRMQIGEAIQLTDGMGTRVRGKVSAITGNSLEVAVTAVQIDPVPDLEITLVQALAKGDRDELAVQAATELGVSQVIPWQANRSVSRWDLGKEVKGVARWQQIVNEAGKQSLRAIWPKVSGSVGSSALAKQFGEFDLVLVLDTSAGIELRSVEIPSAGRIAIVVGPEGGIAPEELEIFNAAGAVLVSLGERILRTSTAGPAVLALITLR